MSDAPTPDLGLRPCTPPSGLEILPDGRRLYRGLTASVVPGYRPLKLDVWLPPLSAQTPALVVWVHGGAWLFGDRDDLPPTLRPHQLFEAVTDAGLACATIDYRFSSEAPFPAQLHDLAAALRYLRHYADELGVDAGRIGLWGESAGGHLVALGGLTTAREDLLGTTGLTGPAVPIAAVVDWYGVSDLDALSELVPPPEIAAQLPPEALVSPEEQLLAGVEGPLRRAASPAAHVTPAAPPFLLVHGTNDTVVPFTQSVLLCELLAAAGVPVELEAVEGADHCFVGSADVDGIVERSVAFLARHLSAPAAD